MKSGLRILVVGSGGREHALVWKLKESPRAERIFCAPGNAGIAQQAECVSIPSSDLSGLAEFAEREQIGLTVVGPEMPLAEGIVDAFQERGLRVFGPSRGAALLESSKIWCKQTLSKHNDRALLAIYRDRDERGVIRRPRRHDSRRAGMRERNNPTDASRALRNHNKGGPFRKQGGQSRQLRQFRIEFGVMPGAQPQVIARLRAHTPQTAPRTPLHLPLQ